VLEWLVLLATSYEIGDARVIKKSKCRHCVALFQPIRIGHLYCSDTCRKLQFKAQKRAESRKKTSARIGQKLIKLSGSAFGRYLVREIKRAGTVQILQGHTFESLVELVDLRLKCTAYGGYEDGESLGTYELSHIYPAGNIKAKRIGLLHPSNLTITPKAFNRKHATKIPASGYQGCSIAIEDIQPEWSIKAGDESVEILKLTRKYIGEDFDKWLKKHLISYTQKQVLVKVLKEADLPTDMLLQLSLRELKELATEEDLPYFSINKNPLKPQILLSKELARLNVNPELAEVLRLAYESTSMVSHERIEFNGSLEERKEFDAFVIKQSLACLHGQPYSVKLGKKTLKSYFKKVKPRKYKPSWGDDEIL
jgi:hypothetical protein